ncbi:virulence factor BrkB family protein [Endothiovibrio diazotrophicus]
MSPRDLIDNEALQHPLRFLRYLLRNTAEDRVMQTASGLAYTFLLSLVPLTTMVFALLSAFPVFQGLTDPLNDFIFDNFVPTAGATVREHLTQFSQQTKQLTSIGTLVLLATALMMLRTIDRALNDIWKVKVQRNGLASFLVYWAVLSLGPILVGMSLAVTSYLVSLPLLADTTAGLHKPILALVPFALVTVAFTLFYLAIPNRRVPLRFAAVGGVVAALLFEAGKRGFAWYVTSFPTYELIYGALAAVPIFLIWVYVSWLIILFGAEVTYCLATYRIHQESGDDPGRFGFVTALRLLATLEEAQRRGDTLALNDLLRRHPDLHEEALRRVLSPLEEARWVQHTNAHRYLLARDLDDLTLLDLHHALPWPLPRELPPEIGHVPWRAALEAQLHAGEEALEQTLSTPLRPLLHAKQPTKSGKSPG